MAMQINGLKVFKLFQGSTLVLSYLETALVLGHCLEYNFFDMFTGIWRTNKGLETLQGLFDK